MGTLVTSVPYYNSSDTITRAFLEANGYFIANTSGSATPAAYIMASISGCVMFGYRYSRNGTSFIGVRVVNTVVFNQSSTGAWPNEISTSTATLSTDDAEISAYPGYYVAHRGWYSSQLSSLTLDLYDSVTDGMAVAADYLGPIVSSYPITYSDTNCVHTGPNDANVGDSVSVNYSFNTGYGIVNPSTDIYVTNNGVVVPSTYSNGVLTFTMPDPS